MTTTPDKLTEDIRRLHEEATQKALAASNASHPLRTQHAPEALHRDARYMFQNMGQTLMPELLKELDEARRLLANRIDASRPWETQALRQLAALAKEYGWKGGDAIRLAAFFRELTVTHDEQVNALTESATRLAEQRTEALSASKLLDEWCSEEELRYAEVSRGRKQRFMVTLWSINSGGMDVKLGHGEGETLEEAVQRAKGVIIL